MSSRSGYGYADVENRLLATPHTVMRIASISKALTAAAVGRLLEQGKLDLDRPVGRYLEGNAWPERHPEITPRQLLSHLSGVSIGHASNITGVFFLQIMVLNYSVFDQFQE